MPRVGYAMPQQGFRPRTNPLGALAGLGLLGLGADNTFSGCVQGYDAQSNPVACNDPSAVVWMDANGNAVPAGTPAAGSAAPGVPTGSTLTYTGQWQTTITRNADDIVQAVIGGLPANGIGVINFASTAGMIAQTKVLGVAESGVNFVVTLQLQVTGSGFAQPSDIGAIVNHLVYSASGKMPLSSNVVVGGTPVSPVQPSQSSIFNLFGSGTSSVPGSSSLLTWFEQNAVTLLLVGAVAFFAVKKL